MKAKRIAAIHQPNFFPWLGYFYKIDQSDAFVILDQVAIPKTGGSYVNRSKILVQGTPKWMICPIVRQTKHEINLVKIDNGKRWKSKLLKTLNTNYKKAIFFEETMEWLEPLILQDTDFLCDYNLNVIRRICGLLNIHTDIYLQSEIGSNKTSDELLIELIEKVNCGIYLSGSGGRNYQKEAQFHSKNIELQYSQFQCLPYRQINTNTFHQGLSVIDCFFNTGLEGCSRMIRSLFDGNRES